MTSHSDKDKDASGSGTGTETETVKITMEIMKLEFEGKNYNIPVRKVRIEGQLLEEEDWTYVAMDWDKFAKVRTDFKRKEQENWMRAKIKSDDEEDTADAIAQGKEPPPPRPEYVWSDLDPRFNYKSNDIPVMNLKGELDLKVTRYRALDRWVAQVRNLYAMKMKAELDEKLSEYCESIRGHSMPQCKVRRICFVKLPSYKEIDELMAAAIGDSVWWKERQLQLKYRTEEEDGSAGTWVRAECDSWSKCRKYGQFTSIDTGRAFPASWVNVRRAVYRFLPFPAGAYRCILILSNPVQITWNIHEKWKWLMERGKRMKVYLIGITSEESLLVRLVKPTENELDAVFKRSLEGGPDPTENPDSPLYDPPYSVYDRVGLFF